MSLLDNDLVGLIQILNDRNIIPTKHSNELRRKISEVHLSIYSILIWDSKLKTLPDRSRYFLHEIRSDAVASLPLALLGYKKASAHAIRSMIENVIRLIYFSDHEVEYRALRIAPDTRDTMTFDEYFDYIARHPIIGSHVKQLKIIDKLKPAYNETSRYVHASTAVHMQLTMAIDSIKFDPAYLTIYCKILKRISAQINALLCLHYHQKFRSLSPEMRAIIRKALGRSANKYIMSCDPIE